MLRQARLSVLQAAETLGFSRLLLNSSWRRQRLLILCYHGTSLDDEHEWNGGLYLPPELLRRRMETVAAYGCTVLGLDEALRRLYKGTLPAKAAAITFDDGSYDFHKLAFPIIREFGFPVTLYFTTYYSEFNRPVFDTMCSYLLWKGRERGRLEWPEILPATAELRDRDDRLSAVRALKAYAAKQELSGPQKDDLLARLADRLGIDYGDLCRRRVLHLITPGEAAEMARQGLDIQYHTHRHREYRRRERFHRELDDNRRRIAAVTPVEPSHFCYTGGVYVPEFAEYLEAYGIRSAVTCDGGLCSPQSERMLLPRLVDTTGLSELEFRSWLAGTPDLLPKRRYPMSEGQLIDDDA